jgi:zinc transporter ZupT
MAYFINPLIGYGTFLAIATHEAPKILGTVILIRSLTKTNWDAIKYSALCQAGVPLVATFIYVFGKNISGEWVHAVEFAAMATIAVILIRIGWHSYSHRGHAHE